jgi:hypothetical protein
MVKTVTPVVRIADSVMNTVVTAPVITANRATPAVRIVDPAIHPLNTVATAPATTVNRVGHVVRTVVPVLITAIVAMAPVTTEKTATVAVWIVVHVTAGTVGTTPVTMVRHAPPVARTAGHVSLLNTVGTVPAITGKHAIRAVKIVETATGRQNTAATCPVTMGRTV